MTFGQSGYVLGSDDGEAIWFLGTRMTVKAGGEQTHGTVTVIDCACPPGFAPPAHVHHREDEIFYVLEGTLEVTCGDQRWTADPGDLVLLPKGIPHWFEVGGDSPARLLQITTPAQFERFAADVGQPAAAPGLSPPAPPDVERLLATAVDYGIEIVTPPSEA